MGPRAKIRAEPEAMTARDFKRKQEREYDLAAARQQQKRRRKSGGDAKGAVASRRMDRPYGALRTVRHQRPRPTEGSVAQRWCADLGRTDRASLE